MCPIETNNERQGTLVMCEQNGTKGGLLSWLVITTGTKRHARVNFFFKNPQRPSRTHVTNHAIFTKNIRVLWYVVPEVGQSTQVWAEHWDIGGYPVTLGLGP
jgi:hypothetical protein